MCKPRRLPVWWILVLVALLAIPALAQETDPAQSPEPVAVEPAPAPASVPPPVAEPSATPDPEADATPPEAEPAASPREQIGRPVRAVFSEVLKPMWARFASAVPTLLKAFGLLALFWIVGTLLGGGVRRLLGMTRLDNQLAAWLGFEIGDEDSEKVENAIGSAVKWLVLLFGFVAFFQSLNLAMVASPLKAILDSLAAAIPSLLEAGLILLIYWAIASLVRMASAKALSAVGFDERAKKFIPAREIKGEEVGPSSMVGRLLFYLILLFGIPPFLDALGQQALVVPLRDMLAKVLAFLPNVVACFILLFVGKIIATIVREVTTNFLAAAGADAAAEKLGLGQAIGKRKASEVVGAIAYFFIFVPILVAAVDSLQIKAISDPVKNTLEQLLAAIPLLFVATVVILIGYAIARFVRGLVETFLETVGFDGLPEKLGLDFLRAKEGQRSLSQITGTVVMIIIMLLTVEQALATLELTELASIFGALITFLPRLVVGLIVILAALSLGGFAGKLVESSLGESAQTRLVSLVAKYSIVFLGFSMGLDQLGVAKDIIQVAVSAVLGAVALALGLAFGLGGRDRAKEILEKQVGDGS